MKYKYDQELRNLEREAYDIAIKNGHEDWYSFWLEAENGSSWTEDHSKIHSLYMKINAVKSLGKN